MHQQTPPAEIVAGSVTLRRLRPGDGRPLAQAANESLDHLRPWMSFAAQPIEEAAMEQWVLLCSSRFDSGDGFQYAIFDRSSRMVGSIGIDVDEDRPSVVRVGYWLHVDHQGHGYATDAVRALKDLALGPLGMTEVELGCDRANVRSAALAERLGFILRRIDRRAPTNPGETDERLVFSARPTAQDSS